MSTTIFSGLPIFTNRQENRLRFRGMPRDRNAAERLRATVRDYVRKDGRLYERGNAAKLAKALEIDAPWVTGYVDDPPTRHDDFYQSLAICRLYDLSPVDLMPRPKDPPLERELQHALKDEGTRQRLLAFLRLSEEMQQLAIRLLPPPAESSRETHPASPAGADATPRKRGHGVGRGHGTRG
jgi:hypothetical protein